MEDFGHGNPLGKAVEYSGGYDPKLLFPVPRSKYRASIKHPQTIGADIWNCFELSWLDTSGVPHVAIAEIAIPATSAAIVESKSLKLYLGGYAQERFIDNSVVREGIQADLAELLGSNNIAVTLVHADDWATACHLQSAPGECIDSHLKVCAKYQYDPSILGVKAPSHAEGTAVIVHSNLFRSLCPVTGQPDWATIVIGANGGKWSFASLAAYLVSFRNHQGFHEHCCETIFSDLLDYCSPTDLCVECRFTRRGGIDINPIRSSRADYTPFSSPVARSNLIRFARQ